jgi:hypothetical protein
MWHQITAYMPDEAGLDHVDPPSRNANDPLSVQICPQIADCTGTKSSQDRALVISFQRSGLNWLRHCAEYYGGIRTPGRPQLIREGPVLFDRAHDVRRSTKRSNFAGLYTADGREVYGKVALLLRDPYDCFTSHYLGRRGFRFKKGLEAFESYANNINAFDQLWRPEKAVFYFEDYINQEAGTFAFLRFFGIEPGDGPHHFGALIESSRAWYRAEHGVITDQERPKLSPRERGAIREMLQRCLGQKYEKYLVSRIRDS